MPGTSSGLPGLPQPSSDSTTLRGPGATCRKLLLSSDPACISHGLLFLGEEIPSHTAHLYAMNEIPFHLSNFSSAGSGSSWITPAGSPKPYLSAPVLQESTGADNAWRKARAEII